MFKVNNINGEYLDTTSSVASVLGNALHKGMQAYLGGDPDHPTPADEGEAIKHGHDVGLEYMTNYSDGFIEYGSTTPDRAKLNERYAFSFFGFLKESNLKDKIKDVLIVEKMLKHAVDVEGHSMPVPLKGKPDLVYRNHKDQIVIQDHKFTGKHSDEEAIDGAKLIQAAFNFFLVTAEIGEIPHSIVFSEWKITPNQDKTKPQLREFEIVFAENPLIFELFYRMYHDVTDALLGKQVFIPNVYAMFDKEVSLLAYIHRLDINEEREKQFKEMKVDNITDFLKKKIEKDGNMKKYLDAVSTKFVSATTLNYKEMTIAERIKMKLAEHGIGVEFDSQIEGSSLTLYRFEPSIGVKMSKIEAYVKDLEQVIGVSGIRVLAPIPNTIFIGFEVPRETRTFPKLPKNTGFDIAIGETIMGTVRHFDIRTAPHILVAGSTGSGKSVFLNGLIKQLQGIPKVELHLFDPKQVELFQFEGTSKVKEYKSDHREIRESLQELVNEMNERYTQMKAMKVRNIEETSMKYKFIIIDEFADLSMTGGVEDLIQLLAQKGRACGIHIVIATQRASTRIINGDIRVNFPCKIVFRVAKGVDSRVMIDEEGAEKLLGKGDMLFSSDKGLERLQGFML